MAKPTSDDHIYHISHIKANLFITFLNSLPISTDGLCCWAGPILRHLTILLHAATKQRMLLPYHFFLTQVLGKTKHEYYYYAPDFSVHQSELAYSSMREFSERVLSRSTTPQHPQSYYCGRLLLAAASTLELHPTVIY